VNPHGENDGRIPPTARVRRQIESNGLPAAKKIAMNCSRSEYARMPAVIPQAIQNPCLGLPGAAAIHPISDTGFTFLYRTSHHFPDSQIGRVSLAFSGRAGALWLKSILLKGGKWP
jgi:hypothetical protein